MFESDVERFLGKFKIYVVELGFLEVEFDDLRMTSQGTPIYLTTKEGVRYNYSTIVTMKRIS